MGNFQKGSSIRRTGPPRHNEKSTSRSTVAECGTCQPNRANVQGNQPRRQTGLQKSHPDVGTVVIILLKQLL